METKLLQLCGLIASAPGSKLQVPYVTFTYTNNVCATQQEKIVFNKQSTIPENAVSISSGETEFKLNFQF